MKKIFGLVLAMAVLVGCFAFGCSKPTKDPDSIPDTMTSSDGKYTIAMVTDIGLLKDKSFNQGTWNGVKLYANAHDKSYKFYQFTDINNTTDEDRYNAFVDAVNGGAEIIVTLGILQTTALTRAAVEFPNIKFVFIDGSTIKDENEKVLTNVAVVSFQEEQCGYLAGYSAVVEGNTKLGFVGGGGATNPAVNRYGYGFVQGIQDASKKLNVESTVKYSYLYGDTYSASNELKTMVGEWYTSGTQCVFSCGGSMCDSVFSAADENNAKSIGVDVDQSVVSNTVITSAVKGLSTAGQKILGDYFDGNWAKVGGKTTNLGIDDNAVGLPFATSKFTKFTKAEYNALVSSMKEGGTLTVDADYTDFVAETSTFDNVTVNFVK